MTAVIGKNLGWLMGLEPILLRPLDSLGFPFSSEVGVRIPLDYTFGSPKSSPKGLT